MCTPQQIVNTAVELYSRPALEATTCGRPSAPQLISAKHRRPRPQQPAQPPPQHLFGMATRCRFENSNEIGVFSCLTNKYALTAIGGSENFYSVFESELAETVPVIHTSIAGTRVIGRLVVGAQRNNLLTTHTPPLPAPMRRTRKQALVWVCRQQKWAPAAQLGDRPGDDAHPELAPGGDRCPADRRTWVPARSTRAPSPPLLALAHCVRRGAGLSALGNVISCNDYVALVHTDIDKVTRRAPTTAQW